MVNPATQRWDPLPPSPDLDPMGIAHGFDRYLAFDPTISPHYQVFRVPCLPPRPCQPGDRGYRGPEDYVDPLVDKSEWPPSTCIMNVFSSKSCRWEERSFIRDGKAAGTIADMWGHSDCYYDKHYAVYCRGALSGHCETDFVMRYLITYTSDFLIKIFTTYMIY